MNTISSRATTATTAQRVGQTGLVSVGALFTLAILLQVFLAGAGIFAAPNFLAMHRMFGYMLSILPLLAVGLALLARRTWRMVTLYGVAFVLVGLQGVLVDIPPKLGLPLIAALHPVNALIIFALSLSLLYVGWRDRQAQVA